MSEDSGFIRKRMSAGDGFSATEGTENTEKIRKLSGLTPLHFANEPEGLRNAPGLTPINFNVEMGLTPLGTVLEPQMNADERRCCCIGKKHEETENQKNLSGLSVPLSLRGEFHKRGMI